MSKTSVSVKVYYDDTEIKRFTCTSYADFLEKVSKFNPFSTTHTNFNYYYLDEENDYVKIQSIGEWEEGKKHHLGKVMKIIVQRLKLQPRRRQDEMSIDSPEVEDDDDEIFFENEMRLRGHRWRREIGICPLRGIRGMRRRYGRRGRGGRGFRGGRRRGGIGRGGRCFFFDQPDFDPNEMKRGFGRRGGRGGFGRGGRRGFRNGMCFFDNIQQEKQFDENKYMEKFFEESSGSNENNGAMELFQGNEIVEVPEYEPDEQEVVSIELPGFEIKTEGIFDDAEEKLLELPEP